MGYTKQNGQYANTEDVKLHEGALAATADTVELELGDRATVRLALTIVSGTGTLDVDIETSRDGVTWYTAGSFTQSDGTPATERKVFVVDRFIRAECTIGTGPFNFTLEGEAA